MSELHFGVELSWSGTGREGTGHIAGQQVEFECSAPATMGGRGIGTSPEELLVSAVASCYSGTLFGVLRRAGLPVREVRVAASGAVTDYPEQARFARLTVSPTIVGGEPARVAEYEQAAATARERCFIGRTITGNVDYQVGSVAVEPTAVTA